MLPCAISQMWPAGSGALVRVLETDRFGAIDYMANGKTLTATAQSNGRFVVGQGRSRQTRHHVVVVLGSDRKLPVAEGGHGDTSSRGDRPASARREGDRDLSSPTGALTRVAFGSLIGVSTVS